MSYKYLIDEFERGLKERLSSDKFKSSYSSIDDILIMKYKLSNIDSLKPTGYESKTEFIDGLVLTYEKSNSIINNALNLDI